ncbi:MAG: exo-alpha-sialidase [Gemmatimonadetes bacterium]|nr:exo-alpha-sialidase [Gemmatimonadota bacterium]
MKAVALKPAGSSVVMVSLTLGALMGSTGETWAQVRLNQYTVRTMYAPAEGEPGGSYPRVIQLRHVPGSEGQLLATFARRGALPIYRSTDDGETWAPFSEVPGLREQPSLLELPHQAGEFPAGTIYAAGLARSGAPNTTSLQVYVSRDGGRTWNYLSTIIEGGRGVYDAAQRAGDTKETPVWEPYLYLDARGRLVAYYSSEQQKDRFNQFLAHKISPDGGRTWGEEELDVAIPDQLTRPGMSIVARMGNGQYFLIYEVVSKEGYALEPRSNPVHFKISDDGVGFGDAASYGTLLQDRRRQFLWATPYVIWSPYPAPNGTLVASARGVMRENVGQVGNGVMINRNFGQGYWTLLETPIWYVPGPGGYSQTMIPLGDGREILQLVPVDGHIRYARFRLPD